MLDEDLLVGPGRQARDTLRPLAYSTLADLVHHVKDRIDLNQVSRVIQVRFFHRFCLAVPCGRKGTMWLVGLLGGGEELDFPARYLRTCSIRLRY